MDNIEQAVQQAAALMADAERVAVSSGAGISKESGVPTFRDAQEGLWAKYDPQQLATPQAFEQNPDLVWAWYMHRYQLLTSVSPNPGHYAVAQLEMLFEQVVVLTQNIDGLHREAGSTDVVELHGSIRRFKCFRPCSGEVRYVDLAAIEYDHKHAPRCPHCDEGGFVRPDVVWFGEVLPAGALERASQVAQSCDVMLVVGTSGLVQPAASLPRLTKEAGGIVIEVNPDFSMISPIADVVMRGPSGEVLPQLLKAIEGRRS